MVNSRKMCWSRAVKYYPIHLLAVCICIFYFIILFFPEITLNDALNITSICLSHDSTLCHHSFEYHHFVDNTKKISIFNRFSQFWFFKQFCRISLSCSLHSTKQTNLSSIQNTFYHVCICFSDGKYWLQSILK